MIQMSRHSLEAFMKASKKIWQIAQKYWFRPKMHPALTQVRIIQSKINKKFTIEYNNGILFIIETKRL